MSLSSDLCEPMHAIVVDPSRVVLKVVSELIVERGDTVTEFHDSAAALRSVTSDTTVDVLITSLEVQPITGLELCWQARLAAGAQRPLYIVVISSSSDDRRLAEALDCGADDLIAKPVKRVELHARLRAAGRLALAQRHLVLLAETDPLTGLLNRRAFFERLNVELQNRAKSVPISAILFDIDHFKTVNDAYGHDVGDQVIKRIATEAAKFSPLTGRMGGEEFALIVDHHDEKKAIRLADGLRRACTKLAFDADGLPFSVTGSFGVSAWMEGETADKMLKKADIALYQAKAAGRNRVQGSTQPAPPVASDDGLSRIRRRGLSRYAAD